MGYEYDYQYREPPRVSRESTPRVSSRAEFYRGSATVEELPAVSRALRSRRNESTAATSEPRVVEEQHASYRQIQRIIEEFSDRHGVSVKQAPQVEVSGRSSPRPSFLKEAAFLREHVSGIRFPNTVDYRDYQDHQFIDGTVMKNQAISRGQQKYLLTDPEQMNRFRQWMKTYGKPCEWIAQEYIQTPGNAPCSFRVLVDCTGHVVTSQISYGPPHNMGLRKDGAKEKDVRQDSAKHLEFPKSKFFLEAPAIASNHMLLHGDDTTTGGRITLDPLPVSHPYSRTEQSLLRAHDLPTDLPMLPPEIARVASGIGKAIGMKGNQVRELVLGVDVIQKRGTNEYYVLEVNRRPSMVAIRDMLGSADSIKEVDAWRWLINGALLRTALREA